MNGAMSVSSLIDTNNFKTLAGPVLIIMILQIYCRYRLYIGFAIYFQYCGIDYRVNVSSIPESARFRSVSTILLITHYSDSH